MAAYNAVDGVPAAASRPLLADLLRGRLGFQGLVLTDKFGARWLRAGLCAHRAAAVAQQWLGLRARGSGPTPPINKACPALPRPASPAALDSAVSPKGLGWADGDLRAATAAAIGAGVDLVMKNTSALHADDLQPGVLDGAVRRVLRARLRMGHLDPPGSLPWAALDERVIGSEEHAATALKLAQQSLVLLKNEQVGGGSGRVLPGGWRGRLAGCLLGFGALACTAASHACLPSIFCPALPRSADVLARPPPASRRARCRCAPRPSGWRWWAPLATPAASSWGPMWGQPPAPSPARWPRCAPRCPLRR